MARNSEQDQATFEQALSNMFGTDMRGWTRLTSFDRGPDHDGEVTRLVLAIDANGMPVPAAGTRREGYTLGGVLIASISHIEFGGVHPQVQINVWDPLNNRLLETGHSTPSTWELDTIVGDDPNWLEKPELVDRVLAEFESNVPDAVADALSQLELGGRLATTPADPWADSLGHTDTPTEDSRDSQSRPDDTSDQEESPADVPRGTTETVPWVPESVHEAVPWNASRDGGSESGQDPDPADMEAWPGQAEYLERLANAGPPEEDIPIGDIESSSNPNSEPSGVPTVSAESGLDTADMEAWPGQAEFLERLANAGPPEESIPIGDIKGQDWEPDPPPPRVRDTSVRWAGTTSGRLSVGQSVRVIFTDVNPARDANRQPITVISADITTSTGASKTVPLFLLSGGADDPDGSAVYGSHVLTLAGEGVNNLPAQPGDSVSVAIGGRSATISRVFGRHLEMVHAIQIERLETLGYIVAATRRSYFAETAEMMDDPVVGLNRRIFDEDLRTIQHSLEHVRDPGVLKEQVARTQYYLDHVSINAINMVRLSQGKSMISPYHEDIRQVTKLKHSQSMISFYQSDVVIREHFTTLVEDAEAYGQFMRGEAVGKHFDNIATSMVLGSYDTFVGETPMSWLYPILSFAVTGEAKDHWGKVLTAGDVAALAIDVALKGIDFRRSVLEHTNLNQRGGLAGEFGGSAAMREISDAVTKKGMAGASSLASRGVGAGIDYIESTGEAGTRGTDAVPTPTPPRRDRKSGLSTTVRVGAGGLALVTLAAGGVFITSNSRSDDQPAPPPPAAVVQQDPQGQSGEENSPPPQPDTASDEPLTLSTTDPPQIDATQGVADDDLFDIPVPERPSASLDAPATGGLTAQEVLLLPAPDPSSDDDAQRPGGGSLYVDATYVVDWKDNIRLDNGVITPGYLFPPGSGWNGEYLILADCDGQACVYSTPLATGDTLTFTQQGSSIYGTVQDPSGGCNRDIFIAFKVSDFQMINGRLVPDAILGARIETGDCGGTAVYREITYEGGFEFVGSYNDV